MSKVAKMSKMARCECAEVGDGQECPSYGLASSADLLEQKTTETLPDERTTVATARAIVAAELQRMMPQRS